MKLKRWAGNVFCAALLTGFILLLAGCAMGRAPVSGVVVDSKTGEPIKGAELSVEASYYYILPPSEVEQGGADGEGVSDEKGVFHISAAGLFGSKKETGVSPINPVNWIFPRKVNGIDVCVYARDYVTIFTGIPVHPRGKKWSKNGVTVDKKITGYVVTVKMEKATTQKAWRRKCDTTIDANEEGFAKDEWVFNDLTGYLQRFPDGEKAGDFLKALVAIALPIAAGQEEYCYQNPRTDLDSARLELGIKANEAIILFLPKIDMGKVYREDPLFKKEMQSYLPNGFAEGIKYANWLLGREHHENS